MRRARGAVKAEREAEGGGSRGLVSSQGPLSGNRDVGIRQLGGVSHTAVTTCSHFTWLAIVPLLTDTSCHLSRNCMHL